MTLISQIGRTRRPLLIAALAVLVFAAGAAATYRALPSLVSDDRLRAAVIGHAATWSGGALRLPEHAAVSLHQGRVISLGDVTFGGSFGGAEWQLDVDSIEARMRLFPLLRGEVEIETLTLKAPRFRLIEHDASAMAALRDLPVEGSDLPRPEGEVIVTDARFVYEGPTGRRVGFGGVDLRMAADPDSAGVLMTGGLPAGTGRLDLQGRLDDPAAVLSGRGSDARLVLRRAAKTEAAGTPPPEPQPEVPAAAPEGQVLSAVRRIAAAIGLTGTRPVAIEGRVAAMPRTLDLADARVSFGGLLAEGDLTVAIAGEAPPFDQLGRVARGASAAWRDAATAISAVTWRDAPVALDWLAPLEVTLAARLRDSRLAGQSVEARRMRLEAAEGRARLDVEAAGDLGRMRGEIVLGALSSDGPPRVSVDGRLEGVDMGATGRNLLLLAPPPLVSPPELPEGTLDVDIDLTSQGGTLGGMATALDGVIDAEVHDGSIAGTDLTLTLEGLADGRDIMTEQDGPLIPSAGRTEFDRAKGRIDFIPGVARVSRFHIRGARYDIDMRGEIDLGTGAMRADGQTRLLADHSEPSPIVELPFGLGGTLTAPVVAAGVPRSGDDLTSGGEAE